MSRSEHHLAQLRNARFLLEQLAGGRDPATRRALPPDHAAQDPDSIRTMFRASRLLHDLEREREGMSTRVQQPATASFPKTRNRAGDPWLKVEEEELIDEFRRKVIFRTIARAHGRSVGAIAARLGRLGLIPNTRHYRTRYKDGPPR